MRVLPGTQLILRLSVHGESSPIFVERATVRWVESNRFGVEFVTISLHEQTRLRQVLGQLGP